MAQALALIGFLFFASGLSAWAQDPSSLPRIPSEARDGAAAAPAGRDKRLEKMIGQMLIVGFPGGDPDGPWARGIADLIHAGKIGGVLLLQENIRSPEQVSRLTGLFRRAAERAPPFIAIDQEGGAVQRLRSSNGFESLPSARRVAKAQDLIEAYGLYRNTAAELRQQGINVNLGPVVDLDAGGASPIIGRFGRSFSADPRIVTEYARMFIMAHRSAGVLTAAKHFPGHGSSRTDSHHDLGDISNSWTPAELEPFRRLVEDKLPDMVMVGHLYHPNFSDGPGVPTVLSRRTVTHHLRKVLGWNGLVVTDDLQMGAVRKRYSLEDSAVQAVAAGNDLLLISNNAAPDPDLAARVTRAIVEAVEKGRIDRKAIETSYARIMKAKEQIQAPTRVLADPQTEAAKPSP